MRSLIIAGLFALGCAGADESPDALGRPVNYGEDGPSCVLAPGEYAAEYSVVNDTCEIGALDTELISIDASGGVLQSVEPPAGCIDEVRQGAGCSVGVTRTCDWQLDGADAHVVYDSAFNFEKGTGNSRIYLFAYSPGTSTILYSCTSTQRVSIQELR